MIMSMVIMSSFIKLMSSMIGPLGVFQDDNLGVERNTVTQVEQAAN